MITLEACTANLESVKAAAQGGADRIELCSALSLDGLTPAAGIIARARDMFPRTMHVLIRSREGDFCYSDAEIESMLYDIELCKRIGVDGIAIGALTPSGTIDAKACRAFVRQAEGLSLTFHRAFDLTPDPQKALEDIIAMGFDRLLTSGQKPNALSGAAVLAQLHSQAAGRIRIMAGAGVNPGNIEEVLRQSHADDVHGSFSQAVGEQKVTSAAAVRQAMEAINNLKKLKSITPTRTL